MTYQTAKALDVAGFHVKPVDESMFRYKKGEPARSSGCVNVICEHGMTCNVENCDYVEVPTLEELIEACGDRLENIIRSGSTWSVNQEPHYEDNSSGEDVFDSMQGGYEGKTLIEAVANLWLALNKEASVDKI